MKALRISNLPKPHAEELKSTKKQTFLQEPLGRKANNYEYCKAPTVKRIH